MSEVTLDRYPSNVVVIGDTSSNPVEVFVTITRSVVPAASLDHAIAAEVLTSALTITPALIANTPVLEIVPSPLRATEVAALDALPTNMLPEASTEGVTCKIPPLGVKYLVPRTVQVPEATKAISLTLPLTMAV